MGEKKNESDEPLTQPLNKYVYFQKPQGNVRGKKAKLIKKTKS